jgi:hypothetical protein
MADRHREGRLRLDAAGPPLAATAGVKYSPRNCSPASASDRAVRQQRGLIVVTSGTA